MTSHDEPVPAEGEPAAPRAPSRTKRRWARWLVGLAAGTTVLVVGAAAWFVVATRNPEPGEFYEPPDEIPESPGSILRSESFDAGLPEGARGWRILYVSTDEHDDPIAVSGLIIAPQDTAAGSHPVLAWAHGTTGIARACAPSLTDRPLEGIPDMSGPLAQGWVIALTDYPGLGTPGPHPYLVGQSQGRAVLDSVRAAHQLDTGVDLDDDYVIWGHSQGGHAALFAGQLAGDHLPDHDLAGVAALAPATRLTDNLAAIQGTTPGNVLTVFAVDAWSRYYPDVSSDILTSRARRPARRLARDCLNQPSRYRIVVDGLTLPHTITTRDVTTDPTWSRRLDQNTPDPTGIIAPVFVAQGLADEIISPQVTQAWVTERCGTGAPTRWHTYADLSHVEVVGPGGRDALRWSTDLLQGTTAPNRCPNPD
jgi:acetyl esterase/lipase